MRTMKHGWLLASLAATLLAGVARAEYEYATIQGYWPLNETDGQTATDQSGNANTGILRDGSQKISEERNGPQWVALGGPVLAGSPVNSVDLDGNNDLLIAAQSASLGFDKSKGAISMWVKPRQIYRQSLFKDNSAAVSGAGMEIQIHSSARVFFNPNRADGNGNNYFMTPLDSIAPGVWTHVVFTWDLSAAPSGDRANPAKVHAYINGSAVQNDVLLDGDVDNLWSNPATTAEWLFGYDPDETLLRGYSGEFADIGVFSQPIGAVDAAGLFANGITGGEANLAAAWKFTEGTGTVNADGTANANDLFFLELNYSQGNGPQFVAANPTGKPTYFDQALEFNGTDNLMTIAKSASLAFDKSKGSLTMWVYFNSLGRRAVFGDTSNGIEWQTSSSPRLFFNPNRREGTDQYFFTPDGSISAGEWMHFAFVWDVNAPDSGDLAHPAKVKVYINGVEQPHDFAFQVGSNPDLNWTTPADSGDLTVGRNRALFDTVNPRWVDGQMADVAIFSTAIGSADVATIYETGVTAFVQTGSRAVGDLNNDGCTNLEDFLILLDFWQLPYQGRTLDIVDFLNLLDHWETGPGCTP